MTLPKTWAEYDWADWVPQKVRDSIEHFWSADQRRSPKDWEASRQQNDAPELGRAISCRDLRNNLIEGKYVHAWNNMGRLITADGTVHVVSCDRWQPLDNIEERIAALETELRAKGITTYREAEWLAEGERRFGSDRNDWAFKCVSCGNIQSANSVLAHGCPEDELTIRAWLTNNCEGRYNKNYGCDWSLSGIFRIHKVVLLSDKGVVYPMFEFAPGKSEVAEDGGRD